MCRKTKQTGRRGAVQVTILVPFLALVALSLQLLPLDLALPGSPVILPVLCALAAALLICLTCQHSASSEAPEPQGPGVRPALVEGPRIVPHSPSRRTDHALPPVS